MSGGIKKIPVNVRFPNRYTGGYDSSTVTDKLRWATIASVKQSRFNRNSDMGGVSSIAKKAAIGCNNLLSPDVLWLVGGETLYYSYDGIQWSRCIDTSGIYHVIDYNGTTWIAGGDGKHPLYSSSNGITWNPRLSTLTDCTTIAHTASSWVAGGSDGMVYSQDGYTWNQCYLDTSGIPFTDPCMSLATRENVWVAGGKGLYYSQDGQLWKTILPDSSGEFRTLASASVSFPLASWVVGGKSSQYAMYYSYDGESWTPCLSTSPIDAGATYSNGKCRSLSYSGTTWFAGGSGYNTLYSSKDGIIWKPGTSTIDISGIPFTNGECVSVFANKGICVAGGIGDVCSLYYSTDTIQWNPCITASKDIPFTGGICTAIAYNRGVWEACGNGPTTFYYSFNGITWIPGQSLPGNALGCFGRG